MLKVKLKSGTFLRVTRETINHKDQRECDLIKSLLVVAIRVMMCCSVDICQRAIDGVSI